MPIVDSWQLQPAQERMRHIRAAALARPTDDFQGVRGLLGGNAGARDLADGPERCSGTHMHCECAPASRPGNAAIAAFDG